MPSITIHPRTSSAAANAAAAASSLPEILQTPSGLALLEIQGSINMSDVTPASVATSGDLAQSVGKLVFPDYNASDSGNSAWSAKKRVYLYVGRHQRLTGEVKKLSKPVAVLRRKTVRADDVGVQGAGDEDALEVAEIVRWKVVFSQRPEPVGGGEGSAGVE